MSFDARPLTAPVDRNAVRAYARRLRAGGATPSLFGSAGSIAAVIVVAVFVVMLASAMITVMSVMGGLFASIGSSGSPGSVLFGLIGAVLPLVVIGGVLAAIVLLLTRGLSRRSDRMYRLDRFAAANGLSYVPALAAPALPGMIFDSGGSRLASDLVRGEHPRFVEFANYQYTTGSGKNRTTHRWGYVAIKLDVPLPHIVLDATSNNGLFGSNLPMTFDKDQRLSLEGDFDRYFSLYCPEGYERDALYLFTPDIMARFIDSAAALDVEIVDDWLFLYGKREFSGLDPATWAWLFSVVAALLDKFAQWARWRDENLRADAAAVAGAAPASVASGDAGPTRSADGGGAASDPATAPGHAPGGGPDGAAGAALTGAAAAAGQAPGSAPAGSPFTGPMASLRPPSGVALSGRRLKTGISWPAIIAIGLVVAFWLAGQLGMWSLLFR